ncbi:class I SAM-dependent methyltransferase [bacterium]|jgi:tRNA (uracil-5-)-methyltransferase TRM9|nr:class I SAM-dependent methyltransferase [bacterium]MBT4121418.1 class I SAM-dependent methyltransferase [bacterium]MBT4495680.1 class I SAM-dependent methyltransferase [bacterium]MBT4763799.1 class I SAM-dependent methyltransferase [bacterium]MBT5401169.1 class I SAM-dependent methyltransferase [bacterium]
MNKSDKIVKQVKDGYNKIADHFSSTRYAPWTEFNLFSEYIRDNQKILDLGCGNGRLYKYLKEQDLNIEYYGIDISNELLKIVEERYPEVKSNLTEGSITKLPYEDNTFDLVVCIAVFLHLPSKAMRLQALSEVQRVLKPGGHLLMKNWHMWHKPYLKHYFNKVWLKRSWKDYIMPWKSSDGKIQCQRYYHVFTRRELKKLFKKSNLKVIKNFLFHEPNRKVYGRGVNIVSIAKK